MVSILKRGSKRAVAIFLLQNIIYVQSQILFYSIELLLLMDFLLRLKSSDKYLG